MTNSPFRHFSTNSLGERDRVPFWRDVFADVIVQCGVEVEPVRPLHAEADLVSWPGLSVIWSKETPMRYVRSSSRAADGDDSVVLLIRQKGSNMNSCPSKADQSYPDVTRDFFGVQCDGRQSSTQDRSISFNMRLN